MPRPTGVEVTLHQVEGLHDTKWQDLSNHNISVEISIGGRSISSKQAHGHKVAQFNQAFGFDHIDNTELRLKIHSSPAHEDLGFIILPLDALDLHLGPAVKFNVPVPGPRGPALEVSLSVVGEFNGTYIRQTEAPTPITSPAKPYNFPVGNTEVTVTEIRHDPVRLVVQGSADALKVQQGQVFTTTTHTTESHTQYHLHQHQSQVPLPTPIKQQQVPLPQVHHHQVPLPSTPSAPSTGMIDFFLHIESLSGLKNSKGAVVVIMVGPDKYVTKNGVQGQTESSVEWHDSVHLRMDRKEQLEFIFESQHKENLGTSSVKPATIEAFRGQQFILPVQKNGQTIGTFSLGIDLKPDHSKPIPQHKVDVTQQHHHQYVTTHTNNPDRIIVVGGNTVHPSHTTVPLPNENPKPIRTPIRTEIVEIKRGPPVNIVNGVIVDTVANEIHVTGSVTPPKEEIAIVQSTGAQEESIIVVDETKDTIQSAVVVKSEETSTKSTVLVSNPSVVPERVTVEDIVSIDNRRYAELRVWILGADLVDFVYDSAVEARLGSQVYATHVERATATPLWEEEARFSVGPQDTHVHFQVYQEPTKALIGRVSVPLAHLFLICSVRGKALQEQLVNSSGLPCGTILVTAFPGVAETPVVEVARQAPVYVEPAPIYVQEEVVPRRYVERVERIEAAPVVTAQHSGAVYLEPIRIKLDGSIVNRADGSLLNRNDPLYHQVSSVVPHNHPFHLHTQTPLSGRRVLY